MNKRYKKSEERYKNEVEKIKDYVYIKSFRKNDVLSNGKIVGDNPYLKIKHLYCGNEYEVRATNFINSKQRCSKCCGSYENSFAHHIEVELELKLEDVWDFEKNAVNPYHISKRGDVEVWIKCQKKDYHGSYKTICRNYVLGLRCPYCNVFASKKVHRNDSFGFYHSINTDSDFKNKYWGEKNKISPFDISYSSNKKVWIKCQKHNYHDEYLTSCNAFNKNIIKNNNPCSYCVKRKIHHLDSFGYKNPKIIKCWSKDNEFSPFEVAPKRNKKVKFVCDKCKNTWYSTISHISNGRWCPVCNSSKGERKIHNFLTLNNIKFTEQKTFNSLLGLGNGLLSYDFYLPDYNLLIEYQGEFHDGTISFQTKEMFEKQQEHDRRKRQYSKDNNIMLLEIWYYDFDKIEDILKQQLNLQ